MGFTKVPSFHPSYPTSVRQSYFKCNSVARKPLQPFVCRFFFNGNFCFAQPVAVLLDDDVHQQRVFQPRILIFNGQNLSPPRRRGRPKQISGPEGYRMAVGDLFPEGVRWRAKVYSIGFLPR